MTHATQAGQDPKFCLLEDILDAGLLNAVFQPILDLRSHTFTGYEALIRGPADTPLNAPLALFDCAREHGLTLPLERACLEVIFRRFAEARLSGSLFVNLSPSGLLDEQIGNGHTSKLLAELKLHPSRIIFELTENEQIDDFDQLIDALDRFRSHGFQFAIDDLGEGFANLKLWSEIHPDFVKIDRHFIDKLADDPFKYEFVHAITLMAKTSATTVIAEGIERPEDFLAVRDLGIQCAQGYLISRPEPHPPINPHEKIRSFLAQRQISVQPGKLSETHRQTIGQLIDLIEPMTPGACNDLVLDRFERDPQLSLLPVVDDGYPLGLIWRYTFLDGLVRPYRRELFGRKPCTLFMNPNPLMLDAATPLQEASLRLAQISEQCEIFGLIVTENGRYAGVCSGQRLMTRITELQINAARYANPLTQLPGNVPIYTHMDRLLGNEADFVVCYIDIDHFKPFNDTYGYHAGDDLILILAQALTEVTDSHRDLVGHIGGDDFIVLLQSGNWQKRIEQLFTRFDAGLTPLLHPRHQSAGGYLTEDRSGNEVFHPLPTLSVGAVEIHHGAYESHRDLSDAASQVKKLAKRQSGHSLFKERRKPPPNRP
ncbi:MAG: GGDEF domain-containing protein [Methylothermaceae bacterium]|nr:GGDEF domain-containing protein [Methylothermaceae bacterium]